MQIRSGLDRTSGVPLYRQIKNIVRDEIVAHEGDATQPITEEELIRRFGVSRAPVRQALNQLADEGYVYRERAKGTFPVTNLDRQVRRPDNVRVGELIPYLRSQGMHPTSHVQNVTEVDPTPEERERHRLEPGERLLQFRRVIDVEDEPLLFGLMRLRAPEGFRPTAEELESVGSAFAMLERDHGISVARAEHEVWAAAADATIADLLAVEPGSPVLMMESTFSTKDGRVIGWRTTVHRPNHFKYRFSTTP